MKSEQGFSSCLPQIDKEALDTQVKDKKIQEAVQRAHDDSIGIYHIIFFFKKPIICLMAIKMSSPSALLP